MKQLPNKYRKGVSWLALFGLIVLAGLYAFRAVLIAPHATAFLERALASHLGLHVSIERLGGTYFTNLEIEHLTTLEPATEGPITSLDLRRLRLAYYLPDLLKGLTAFIAGTTIELEGASLTIDLAPKADTGKADEALVGVPLPRQLPHVSIRNSSFSIRHKGNETRFVGISLSTRRQGQAASHIKLRVSEWSWRHEDLGDAYKELDIHILYEGDHLSISKLAVGDQQLVESATIDLKALPEKISFQARLKPAGGQLEARGSLDSTHLQTWLEGSGINLAQISRLLASHLPPFGGILSVRGQLGLPLTNMAGMTADLEVEILGGRVYDNTVDQITAKLTAESGRLQVRDLRLVRGNNQVTIRRAFVPAAVAFAGKTETLVPSLIAEWNLKCADIPSLLKLAGVHYETAGEPMPNHQLVLSGRMENGAVVIADGRLELDSGYVRLDSGRLALPVGDRRLADSPIAADLQVDLSEFELLSRIFALPKLGGSIRGRLQVEGTLGAPRGIAAFTADTITHQGTLVGDLSVRAIADRQRLVIESALLKRGSDRIRGQGIVDLSGNRLDDVQFEVDVSDLGPYVSELAPLWRNKWENTPEVHGSLEAAATFSGPFQQPVGALNLQVRKIRIGTTPFGEANLDCSVKGDRLTVTSAAFRNGNDHVLLSGSFDSKSRRLDDAAVTFDIAELKTYTQPWLREKATVSGSLNGRLQASGDLLEPDAQMGIRVDNLRVNDIHIKRGILQARNTGRQLAIEVCEIASAVGRIGLVGTIRRNQSNNEFDIKLDEAALSGQATLLELQQPAFVRVIRNGSISIDNISLSGSAGRLTVGGKIDPKGESDLFITAAGLRSDGWFHWIASDRISFRELDARIHLSGRTDSPRFAATGTLGNLGAPNMPVSFSGRFDLDYRNQTLRIREFLWSAGANQQVHLSGSLPVDLFEPGVIPHGQIAVTARAEVLDASVLDFLVPRYRITGGSMEINLRLTGTWSRPTGELHLRFRSLDWPRDLTPLPPGPFDVIGDIRIDGDRIVFEVLEAVSPVLQVNASGKWSGAPAPVDLLNPKTRKLTGRINLEGSMEAPDLSWLGRRLEGVRRLTGRLQVWGTLQGPVAAPAGEAIARLSDGELSPAFDMPSLHALNMEAHLTPGNLQVQFLSGELGGAPFELSGTLSLTAETESASDLKLRGQNLLLFRNENLHLRADTDLTLKGPLPRLELAGEIAVTDGRFSKNLGVIEGLAAAIKQDSSAGFQLFSLKEPPLRDMVFNVKITAREPFQIRNNLVKGAVRPDLLLTGTGEVPLLSGKAYVETTRLYLPAGVMKLESGLVRFERNDPDRPKLDLLGTASMLGYDITAVIDGPYDEPVVTLSSVPPLPNEDLLMLLLAGRPPKKSGFRDVGRRQQMNVAVFLGRDLLSRLFGGDSEEVGEFILDRFDVEVGRGVSRQGEETIHAQFRLADSVLLDGDILYLTGERDIFDYYNGGVKIVFRFR